MESDAPDMSHNDENENLQQNVPTAVDNNARYAAGVGKKRRRSSGRDGKLLRHGCGCCQYEHNHRGDGASVQIYHASRRKQRQCRRVILEPAPSYELEKQRVPVLLGFEAISAKKQASYICPRHVEENAAQLQQGMAAGGPAVSGGGEQGPADDTAPPLLPSFYHTRTNDSKLPEATPEQQAALILRAFEAGDLTSRGESQASHWFCGELDGAAATLEFRSRSHCHSACNLKVLLPCDSLHPRIEAYGAVLPQQQYGKWLADVAKGPLVCLQGLSALLSELAACRPCTCILPAQQGQQLEEMQQVGSLPPGTLHLQDAGDVNLWRSAACEVLIWGMSRREQQCEACSSLQQAAAKRRHSQVHKVARPLDDLPGQMTREQLVEAVVITREKVADLEGGNG